MRISDWSSDVCSSDLLLQDGSGATDSLFGIQGAVGFQVQDQFVQVGALLDTGVFHHVGDTTDRAERCVELQTADAAAFVFVALTRSEERRVGKELVRSCRSRWGPDP